MQGSNQTEHFQLKQFLWDTLFPLVLYTCWKLGFRLKLWLKNWQKLTRTPSSLKKHSVVLNDVRPIISVEVNIPIYW